jgi:hypothetical protein
VRRHEHHSPEWYRSNGWSCDDSYGSSGHRRYYNDHDRCYIDEYGSSGYGYGSSYGYGNGYGYGYSQPATVYRSAPVYRSSSYGVDYETAIAVQEALYQAGYYNGAIDGIIGAGSRAAIASYQYDNGLPETGRIDASLVQSLGLY